MSSPGNAELGEFLRTRRSHMDARKAGIPESTRRRVPGLRRQELARLASISPDYYTRLELHAISFRTSSVVVRSEMRGNTFSTLLRYASASKSVMASRTVTVL